MKVLHIIDNLGLGGAQTLFKGLAESRALDDNFYFYSLRKSFSKNNPVVSGTNIQVYNSYSKFSLLPFFSLKNFIQEKEIQALHCHLIRACFFGFLIKIVYFPKIKLIFHEHGRIFTSNLLYLAFLHLSKKTVDLYVSISEATSMQFLTKIGVQDNVKLIYNFVDTNKFNVKNITWNVETEREKMGFLKEDFVVGFAGRLIERKGWKDFIDAAYILSQANSHIKFLIAGDGEQRENLKNYIDSLNFSQKPEFIGYVLDMVWCYSLIDCFVIPSHWEPMGIAELEAMAMGIPVVASNVPGLNEVVLNGQTGLLFEKEDSKDLSEKILQLSTDTQLKERIISESQTNLESFSLKNYNQKLDLLYDKLEQ